MENDLRINSVLMLDTLQPAGDLIHIEELELQARIGVSAEERNAPQRLTVSVTLWPAATFDQLQDQLAYSVDYAAVAARVKKIVSERSDRLLETLAASIVSDLLRSFSVQRVRLELRKFVLPDARHVSVALTREQSSVE